MKETKFKQTEVGLIPSDWEVYELGQLYNITSSKRVFQKDWTTAGIPFYRAREIAVMSTGKTPEEDLFITKEMFESYTKQYGRIKENDVLITGVGTLGKVYVVKQHDEFYFKDGNIIWLQWKGKNSSSLLKQFYETEIVINQIFGNSGGSTVATYTIANAKKTKLPLPPTIEEQKRIAQALSDVDAVISTTEKLIAKKKALKQGTMQTLLSGKMRIPNGKWIKTTNFKQTELGPIPQEWEVTKIGEFTKVQAGGTPSTSIEEYWNGNIRWMNSGELNLKRVYDVEGRITELGLNNSSTHLIPRYCVLIGLAGQGKTRGTAAINYVELCTNQSIAAIFPSPKHNSEYLYQNIDNRYSELRELSDGGGGRGGLNLRILNNFDIALPPINEQTAIATVLSDMDSEIAALETKLAKYRQLKTGMMQQLLTGKVRLVDSAETASENQSKHSVPLSFKRSVLAAEIADRLCDEPTFGHVKMEKMLFLTEKMCNIDIDSSYHRDAAGPFDNRGLHSIDSQLAKQKWFKAVKQDKGYRYAPLEKRGGHKQYFERYFSDRLSVFNNIINIFKTANTEQCEIVATLYSAWEDFLKQGISPTDEQIVTEVLTNWHKSKERISKNRWLKALLWMKDHEFIPEVGEKIK